MRRRRSYGFTLIELLVVIAIIGILAAIAITNYMAAMTRARQKRTMADIRTIATAWEARAGDAGRYTPAGFTFPSGAIEVGTLETMLVPAYTKSFPKADAWGTPLEFAVEGTAGRQATYAIRSAGRDRRFEGPTYTPGTSEDADTDIVFSGGQFIVSPQDGRSR